MVDTDETLYVCVSCQENARSTRFQCGHSAYCVSCVKKIINVNDKRCPLCREPYIGYYNDDLELEYIASYNPKERMISLKVPYYIQVITYYWIHIANIHQRSMRNWGNKGYIITAWYIFCALSNIIDLIINYSLAYSIVGYYTSNNAFLVYGLIRIVKDPIIIYSQHIYRSIHSRATAQARDVYYTAFIVICLSLYLQIYNLRTINEVSYLSMGLILIDVIIKMRDIVIVNISMYSILINIVPNWMPYQSMSQENISSNAPARQRNIMDVIFNISDIINANQ